MLQANAAQLAAVLRRGRASPEAARLLRTHASLLRTHASLQRGEHEGLTRCAQSHAAFLAQARATLGASSTQHVLPATLGLVFLCAAAALAWREQLAAVDAPTRTPPPAESRLLYGFHGLHALSYLGSSLVEEEHYTCQFIAVTVLLLHARQRWRDGALRATEGLRLGALLGLQRVLWGWHAGGIKWAVALDVAKWIRKDLEPVDAAALQVLALRVCYDSPDRAPGGAQTHSIAPTILSERSSL